MPHGQWRRSVVVGAYIDEQQRHSPAAGRSRSSSIAILHRWSLLFCWPPSSVVRCDIIMLFSKKAPQAFTTSSHRLFFCRRVRRVFRILLFSPGSCAACCCCHHFLPAFFKLHPPQLPRPSPPPADERRPLPRLLAPLQRHRQQKPRHPPRHLLLLRPLRLPLPAASPLPRRSSSARRSASPGTACCGPLGCLLREASRTDSACGAAAGRRGLGAAARPAGERQRAREFL